jgi:hypothetical protein
MAFGAVSRLSTLRHNQKGAEKHILPRYLAHSRISLANCQAAVKAGFKDGWLELVGRGADVGKFARSEEV